MNFSGDTVPDALKAAPHFLLNNPVALQRKYLKLKDDPNANVKQGSTDSRDVVKAEEQSALGMLVEIFNWLDGLEPQPVTEIVPPQNTSALMDRVTPNKAQTQTQTPAIFALLAGGTRILSAVGMGCELEARVQPQSGMELMNVLRKVEEKMQEGVWRVRQIFVGE